MGIALPEEIDPHKKMCVNYEKKILPKLLEAIDKSGGSLLAQINSHTLNDTAINGGSLSFEGDLNGGGMGKVYSVTKEANVKPEMGNNVIVVDSEHMGPNIGYTILEAIEAKEWNQAHPNGPLKPQEKTLLNDARTVVNTITIVTETDLLALMKRKFFGQVMDSGEPPVKSQATSTEKPVATSTVTNKKPIVATA